MVRSLIALLLSYITAVPLTDKIALDPTQTDWANIWTYVIWAVLFAVWGVVLALQSLFSAIADR